MKNNKLIIFAFALIGLFYSCDDAIDIIQPGEINSPDDVYNSLTDLDRGLNGVYATLSPDSSIEFTSIFTDEVALGRNNGGQGINEGEFTFQLNAGSPAAESIWGANYSLINFANRILAASERIGARIDALDHDSDEYLEQITQFNAIVGQLYAIRAYAHFQLLSFFSTDLKDDNALGVIILKIVPDENYNTFLPRSTNGEVFAFIEEDLTKALSMMDPGSVAGKFSPRVVNALRARMAAYRGKYADVITLTAPFVNPAGGGIFPLESTSDGYYALWTDENDSEVIFEVKRVFGDFGIGGYWNTQSSSFNGSPFFEVGRSLYNLFDGTDIRGGISIVDGTSKIASDYETVGAYRDEDVLVINKYPGKAGEGDPLLNDVKIFRVSEMYLLRAEAFAALGNLTGSANSADNVLRILRARRHGATQSVAAVNAYPLLNFTTQQEAFAAILEERRRELCFEGFRYIDIKRLGVLAGGLGVDRYRRDCENYNSCTLSPTDFRFTLPIPTSELVANPAIRGQQNPGY